MVWDSWTTSTNTTASSSTYTGPVWSTWTSTGVYNGELRAAPRYPAGNPRIAQVPNPAIERADRLLESILNEAQREHLREKKWFLVRGKSGTLYRVRRGRAGNVDQLDAEGKVVDRFCAHPTMYVPDGDTMAGQKLMLETDDVAFQRLANSNGPGYRDQVPAEEVARFLALHRAPMHV